MTFSTPAHLSSLRHSSLFLYLFFSKDNVTQFVAVAPSENIGGDRYTFVCWKTDKLLGAVYGDYNSRPTKEISFSAFFKSVTTKYM